MLSPTTKKDFDRKYKWKIYIPVTLGWPQAMSKIFKLKAELDVWLTQNDIKGETYYNMLYLLEDKDVVHFKLSWTGKEKYTVEHLHK